MELDPGSFVAVQMVRAYLLNDSLLIASYIKHRLVHNFVVADQINFMDLLTWLIKGHPEMLSSLQSENVS